MAHRQRVTLLHQTDREEEALKRKRQALERQARSSVQPALPRKIRKKNDTSRLDVTNLTPRRKVELDGAQWVPPTRAGSGSSYDEPGLKWKEASQRKLDLLTTLARKMKVGGLLEQPMTFSAVMEYIGADQKYDEDFSTKVFVHLLGLILHKHRYVDLCYTPPSSLLSAIHTNTLFSCYTQVLLMMSSKFCWLFMKQI